MSTKPSIAIVLPAFNEEEGLRPSVCSLLEAMAEYFREYEIIILNDGSTDGTRLQAELLGQEYPHVRVFHHDKNMGLGVTLREGFSYATKDYTMWYVADNQLMESSMRDMFKLVGDFDLIIPFHANPEFRSRKRQYISRVYVTIMNALFGLKLKYYNGVIIYKTSLIQATRASSRGFAFLAEALIPIVKSGASYVEVPAYCQRRVQGASKAFRIKNLLGIGHAILKLFWRIHIAREHRFLRGLTTPKSQSVP